MTTHRFATLSRDNELTVILVEPGTQRHVEINNLGTARSRRAGTLALVRAGYEPRGAWRTTTEGDDVRSLA